MANPWDAPPNPGELKAAGWDTPPTPEELGTSTPVAGGPSVAESVSRGVGQGGTLGFGDELIGLFRALRPRYADYGDGPVIEEAPAGETFGERYRSARNEEREANKAAQEANPKTSFAANLLGGGAVAAGLPAFLAAKGAPLASRVAQGAASAAPVGAAYGLGGSEAETLGGLGADTLAGGVAGTVLGGALPVAGAGVRRVTGPVAEWLRTTAPRARTIPAAARLKAEGVKGLTAGQMAGPDSLVGQLEAVSANNPLGMAAEREAAKQSFMRAAQDKGLAPGAQRPTSTDLQVRLREILEGFGPAYDPIKGKPIPPEAVAGLPAAAAVPRRGVDARTTGAVKGEIENALTVLGRDFNTQASAEPVPGALVDQFGKPILAPPKAPPRATAGDLLKVRENIREQVRVARQSQDFDRLRLLDEAEDVVTGALEQALTPDEALALQAADRQYARAMTAANAAPVGRTEFTPYQYLKQVEKSAGRRAFKKGEAGDLQDLGEAGLQTFVDAPMTGYRGAVMSSIPGAKYLAAPVSRWANTPAGLRFLFNPRQPSAVSRGVANVLDPDPATQVGAERASLAQLVEWLRSRYGMGGPAPAIAEEESSR